MKKRKKRNTKLKKKWIGGIITFVVIVIITLIVFKGIDIYKKANVPNVRIEGEKHTIKIKTGSDYRDVYHKLVEAGILIDTADFSWMATKMNYVSQVKPGNYLIEDGMTNRELIRMLRSGNQQPVKLMFHNISTVEELAGSVANQIEADSTKIVRLLYDKNFIESYGFSPETVYALFIPNTYEFYWDTDAEEFIERMKTEHDRFWDKNRTKKLDELEMSEVQVSTLASIVDAETYMDDEMAAIAGVYLNRLEKGIRLQADPTIKFAVGNIHMRRVLRKHLNIDSPYNTYRNDGLPPGPIGIPSIAAIDAVLDAEDHEYIYFAAKPDFSGYHNFAKTLNQHLRNAREYQRALNRQRIYK
jgi:UPF0755 protein